MKKIIGLVASLTVIAGVCAAVLAYVNMITKEPISATELKNKLDAARIVMPQGVVEVVPVSWEDAEKKKPVNFIGKNVNGETVGYAFTGRDGGGYGGDIVLMVGFEKDRKTVVCYKTLKAAETPGLGMKLNTPEFAGQFRGKDATTLKLKKKGGQIEAITSATITSKAVIRAVADAQKKVLGA